MYQVEGKHLNNKYFYLDADQDFNYSRWRAPISWSGIVDGQRVHFTQIDEAAYDITCFDWNGFPEELANSKIYIARAIDNAMRVMD